MARRIVLYLLSAVSVTLCAGLVAAALISYAPGTGIDERSADFHLSAGHIRWLNEQYAAERSLAANCGAVARGLRDGTLGTSTAFQMPVRDLLKPTLAATAQLIACGTVAGWILASMLALARLRLRLFEGATELLSSALLVVPAGAVACAVGLTAPVAPYLCVAAAVFARTAPHLLRALEHTREMAFVRFARVNGVNGWELMRELYLPALGPQLRTLLGISVSTALGTAFAAEIVCDRPGLGSFAIRSAMARDPQPVIVVTMLVCAITILANPRLQPREAEVLA